ncbi:MAG: TIGR01777 family oxidoreductase [Planctomycetes bacterium]|nr:TIGR01777 family oxidoreductase [Planctomycetota bacterium]
MGQRIAISGASGFVGRALIAHLERSGHEVLRLVRGSASEPHGVRWQPDTGELDGRALGAVDAVVHLAGENVAGGRWTPARRAAIAASRGPTTERLARSLARLPVPPRTLISASATGIYGDCGDARLDERTPPGQGFLAEVAQAWEAATQPAASAGIRVVHLRIGMVLDQSGGALARMLLPFRLGLGGRLGSGQQWVSWIHRQDLVAAIAFLLGQESLRGPVLAVAPEPVTNREFTRALGRALRRPAVLPVPAFALRLLFGAMADELLLSSQRATPRALLTAGFQFAHPNLAEAFAAALAPGARTA